jgi:hypothetical protein
MHGKGSYYSGRDQHGQRGTGGQNDKLSFQTVDDGKDEGR